MCVCENAFSLIPCFFFFFPRSWRCPGSRSRLWGTCAGVNALIARFSVVFMMGILGLPIYSYVTDLAEV